MTETVLWRHRLTPSPRAAVLLAVLVLATIPASGCLETLKPVNWVEDTWIADMVQATSLHARGLSGKGVRVAVIDTGIDLSHPEFENTKVLWADLVNGRALPYDDAGHGTHVAGIIKAQGDWSTFFSGFYVEGLAKDVTLIAIKAIGENGTGDESNVARGVAAAVENGAHVIVLSLGGRSFPILGTDTEKAVGDAVRRGVFVVAAAGNLGEDETSCTVTSPATVEGVIAVGAVDKARQLADFSCPGTDNENRLLPPTRGRSDPNKKPELVAPGVDVLSPWAEGKYVQASGTSQAAPVVGAVLALLLEAKPELRAKDAATIQRVKQALMTTSANVGPLQGRPSDAHDDGYGYGLVQAEGLLNALS